MKEEKFAISMLFQHGRHEMIGGSRPFEDNVKFTEIVEEFRNESSADSLATMGIKFPFSHKASGVLLNEGYQY